MIMTYVTLLNISLGRKLLKQHLIRATGSAYIMLLSLSCQEKRKQKRIFAALKGPKSNINGIKNGINHLRFCNVDSLAIRSCNKYCMLVRYSYFPSLFFFIPSLCMHTRAYISSSLSAMKENYIVN